MRFRQSESFTKSFGLQNQGFFQHAVFAQLLSPVHLFWTALSDSSVHGISQARILERVAIPFSRGSSQSTSYLLDVLFANVFSHSFGCLFTFLCPLEHKNFWFWWSPVYFFFGYLCFSVISEKPLLHPRFMKIYAYVIFLGILYFLLLHLSL